VIIPIFLQVSEVDVSESSDVFTDVRKDCDGIFRRRGFGVMLSDLFSFSICLIKVVGFEHGEISGQERKSAKSMS
jgi:hypothetical protein